jgi:hypothetical protein
MGMTGGLKLHSSMAWLLRVVCSTGSVLPPQVGFQTSVLVRWVKTPPSGFVRIRKDRKDRRTGVCVVSLLEGRLPVQGQSSPVPLADLEVQALVISSRIPLADQGVRALVISARVAIVGNCRRLVARSGRLAV